MNEQELGQRIIALTATLYHVSCGLLASEADREDAVQAAIEKAWCKAATLRDDSRLKSWLVRILVNECYTILRRRKRELPVEELPDAPASDNSPEPSVLGEALLTLPAELRVPLILHYMEGLSIREIASVLRCPLGTVLSRMDRGRKRLKVILTEVNDDV